MSVKPLLCPNCGSTVSLQENICKYCGTNYVVETGNIIVNQFDMKKLEHKERLFRDNLPDVVRQNLAPYPKERIVYMFSWEGLGGGQTLLVSNEKLILFEGDMLHWTLPFEEFGGTSLGPEHSFWAAISNIPKITMKLMNLKSNTWIKLPSVAPPIDDFERLKMVIDSAYNLWLMKK
jgi:hypothetical protein